jgi:MYXO-CTERM domain-containing protein
VISHRLPGQCLNKSRIGIGLICLLVLSVGAHAQSTVASCGAPNQSTVWYADVSNASSVSAAAEFTLAGPATVNQLSWWGGFTQANVASASDSFSMNIYSDTGGTVGSVIATVNLGNAGEATTGSLIQSSPEYSYNASFASIALGGGTYFLALQRSGGPGIWGWESANPTAQCSQAYQNSAGAWSYNPSVALAFSLDGTVTVVPEPRASLMCALGLLAVGLLAGRRGRRRSWPPAATGGSASADVPLPFWALVLLGAGLAAGLSRRLN